MKYVVVFVLLLLLLYYVYSAARLLYSISFKILLIVRILSICLFCICLYVNSIEIEYYKVFVGLFSPHFSKYLAELIAAK